MAFLPTTAQLNRILYHASLAPSPHNVQPWQFRVSGERLLVCADPVHRLMRELDPRQKERDIALGAVAENIALASLKEGLRAQITYLPIQVASAEHDSVAMSIEFQLQGDVYHTRTRDLQNWIEARCVNRSLYSPTPVPQEQLVELQTIAQEDGVNLHIISDRERICQLATLAAEAGRFKFTHEATHRELYHYLRFSRSHAARHRDGLPLEHFNIPAWMAQAARIGMDWRMVAWLNRLGYHHVLAYIQESMLIRSAPIVCLLRCPSEERTDYLRGGRSLQRLWLTAAKYGLAVQPHSAVADLTYARHGGYHHSITEHWRKRIDGFPQRLRELFEIEGELHVVNMFRMGYPTRTWPTRSLRRPVKIHYQTSPAAKEDQTNKEADSFYRTLTERNGPFISPSEQALLRRQRIGVAGCGSIGGASLEVLTRMGAENFLLAEPDVFELNNLNRQNATTADIGRHKAEATLERMTLINPHVKAEILRRGLTPENLAYFVSCSVVIVDGVDVTTPSALRMKIMLHEEAYRQQKTVICGYDIAGTQLLRIYDYHNGKRRPLNGKFRNVDVDNMTSLGFLSKVISPLDLPIEMLPVTRQMIAGELESIPQLGPTATQFGVLSAWAVLDAIAGRPLRHRVLIDIPGVLRPTGERWKQFLSRIVGIVRLKLYLNRSMKQAAAASEPAMAVRGDTGEKAR